MISIGTCRVIYLTSPSFVQYQNHKRPTSQPEAHLDEGFHGTAALVGSIFKKAMIFCLVEAKQKVLKYVSQILCGPR